MKLQYVIAASASFLTINMMAHEVKHIESMEVAEKVIRREDGKPVAFKFYAQWCGACKMAKEPFAKAAEKHMGKINVYAVDIDNAKIRDLVKKYNITSLPTVVVLKKDGSTEHIVGARSVEHYEEAMKKATHPKATRSKAEQHRKTTATPKQKKEKPAKKDCGCH